MLVLGEIYRSDGRLLICHVTSWRLSHRSFVDFMTTLGATRPLLPI
ncbi:hypothetical protein [Eremococcus coleocola]|nr:hypothetical protein [Eremococcus coleocola]